MTTQATVSSDMADDDPPDADDGVDFDDEDNRPNTSRLTIVLLVIIVIAAIVGAGTAGWLVGHRTSGPHITASSVDAGFARDMSTHHTQAVVMAGYTRLHTTNPSVLLLANDIYNEQTFEIGEMQGWLDSWGLTRSTTLATMSWMGGSDHLLSDGLMPGMATPAEIAKLETLSGNALDVDFLQLMIRHHQGGLPMEQYAVSHASQTYVQTLAANMEQAQSTEIISMEQLLRQLGGTPLPPPPS